MSLANIQHLMLSISIDPQVLADLQQNPTAIQERFGLNADELAAARRLDKSALTMFQFSVASKRMRRFTEPYVNRTLTLLPFRSRVQVLRQYITQHVMRRNSWAEHIESFLDFLAVQPMETPEQAQILRAVADFEKWVYSVSKRESVETAGEGVLYALSRQAAVREVPFEAEFLIEGGKTMEQMQNVFGRTGYVLAQNNGYVVDLFEIDRTVYDFLNASERPATREELLVLAERVIAENGADVEANVLIEELLELGVVVPAEAEGGAHGWQEGLESGFVRNL
jgi:hypothetical protein